MGAETKRNRGWAWCFKCECLFFIDTEWLSYCPAGGAHDETFAATFMYGINTEQTGESGWWRCVRCQGLYKDNGGLGLMNTGECPAPQGASAFDKVHSCDQSIRYFVEKNNTGDQTLQQGWRRCRYCHLLFFSGHSTQGKCAKGATHDATDSAFYSIYVY